MKRQRAPTFSSRTAPYFTTVKPKSKRKSIPRPLMAKSMTPEKKRFDLTTIPVLNVMTPLALVTLGALDTNRVGNKFVITNVNVRATFVSAAPNNWGTFRGMLVLDTMCGGALSNINIVLSTAAPSIGHPNDFRELDNTPRFRVLAEKTIDLASPSATVADVRTVSWSVKKQNIPMLFNDAVVGTAPVIGNCRTNMVYFVWMNNSNSTDVTIQPSSFRSRIRYYDA